ncbi:L-threonylcarbamoyladenylate synthase [Clavibacter michiganensis]|uniref:L-threonylcarbamoyladenylate synthase n=5 Tax=Clavibacter TaxID=1573 RepID=A0A0D5CGY3_9MICO|nr:L-threonylcarbamoyladenylate synthase [Clavibacter michiganensis]AJW78522.1 RNA-binding translation factor [Clavibacter michiganensis subsp. insidiosus]AWF98842.1 threonylcarbamoyl-AMP synthase [Clavibacter michiganensis subsp. insidiosus]AWG00936.1 threonylcarbamoyl-AMP synthase [Clavibacter michiganensis subsp. insidiosus]OQJ60483.1 threonylcarbamoyl-AMP synthase [Clavibacter michiganensis subsp. insidiosus]RMC87194.1 threonylcarbamoyl-AMP synthase [Clavibacter michiganensis subsp. insidi
MARIYDCSVDTDLLTGMRLARQAVGRGEVVVIPTDTVYGIAADAFNPDAVQRLLDAKGRGRDAPPPVLIPGQSTLDALADFVPDVVRRLVDEFWPGGLTVILVAQPSLVWDLGETRGTVALRMPANSYALELLAETGPLAVSSANKTGRPAAATAQEAVDQLGESVDVFLDGGAAGGAASTIVDASRVTQAGGRVRIVREGAVTRAQIQQLIGDELEPVVAAPAEPEEQPVPDEPEAPRGTASGAERVDGSADPAAATPSAATPAAATPAADATAPEPTTDAGPTYPEFVEPADPAPADPAATEPPADPPAHPR